MASCSAGKSNDPVKEYANRAERVIAALNDPSTDYVVVVSHRGDWRNYPENSIAAIESVIRMGVDVMELDLKLTSDSVLVLCHDHTIDRTTTGKGRVSEITGDSIASCFLKTAHNVATSTHRMPTLREALEVCKDRIVVNIDQGFQYYDLVMKITDSLGVTDQMLIKGKKPMAYVDSIMGAYPEKMMYMPIIDINKPKGQALFAEYIESGTVPLAYEVCWQKPGAELDSCLADIKKQNSKIWVNTLWPSLCGGVEEGMYDDYAYDNGAECYKKVLDLGASIIQTDRPDLLISYLKSIGRHD
ncbi:glycerophosphodiester phosphodiesterase family protein [Muribaculum sp.]|uniref:glycerophosphodiester phosphodiesterase family protein n=1 Tax=Muribaculum sp. TaxID=1918611 RepID=UPI002601E64E|nr:glycerophosphodiester phosphodiesterase family protein [Muribaculum sp.]